MNTAAGDLQNVFAVPQQSCVHEAQQSTCLAIRDKRSFVPVNKRLHGHDQQRHASYGHHRRPGNRVAHRVFSFTCFQETNPRRKTRGDFLNFFFSIPLSLHISIHGPSTYSDFIVAINVAAA